MVCLIGAVCVVVSIMDSFVADHANLVVALAGSFADPSVLVQAVDHAHQITASSHDVSAFHLKSDHKLESLTCCDHRRIVFLLTNQPFYFIYALLDFFPVDI